MRIAVAAPGLYVLRARAIAPLLGLSTAKVTDLIKGGDLALSNKGRAVALLAARNASAVYFYGEALSTPYTATNVYFLSKGSAVDVRPSRRSSAARPAPSFTEHLHLEKDVLPMPGYFYDPAADFWMWDYLVAGDPDFETRSFTLKAPRRLAGRSLRVSLMGLSDTGTPGEHHVRVSLNGVVLGDVRFVGAVVKVATFSIPRGTLRSGANHVETQALADTGAPYSMVGVDGFDLAYVRSAVATHDQLLLRADAGGALRVGGLSSRAAWVFDVTRPLAPVLLTARSGGGAGACWVSFATTAGHRYLVSTAAAARSPEAAVGAAAAGAATNVAGADYLVVCPPGFEDAAGALAAYRATQGMTTAVLTTQEVYDDFSYGISTPVAIRSLLAHAREAWSPAPRFVALAGEGSCDYRDNRGYGDSLVPPMLAATVFGLVASDNLLADGDGDLAPDVALGRIPAQTEAELAAYVDKVKRYEASSGDWRSKVLFSADDPDSSGAFGSDSDELAALVPGGYSVAKAYLGPLPPAAARSSIIGAFTEGSLLVNYLGHGGVSQLTANGLLVQSDVASLTSADREPVLAAMTCDAGNYGLSGVDSLAESLMMKADGGAIATFAPTSMEENADSKALGAQFLPALFSAEHPTLGAAAQGALESYAAAGGTSTVIESYALLGDPALAVTQ